MALQYQTVSIKDLGAGIDQQSSENQLAEGFCENLLNCDPKPEGYLAKRPGYEGYAGDLPLRVKEMSFEDGLLCFTFDEDVNLSQVRSSPLLIHGQSDLTTGSFNPSNPSGTGIDFENSVLTTQYYTGFSLISSKTTIAEGTTGNISIELDSQESLVWYAESTSQIDNSNILIVPESSTLSNTPTATGSIVNNTAEDIDVFAYKVYRDFAETYPSTDSITIPGSGPSGHNLDDFSIVVQVYEVSGSDYVQIIPESININQVSQDITITFNEIGTYVVFLKKVPIENVATGTLESSSSKAVPITGLTGDFPYFVIFLDDGSDILEVVEPDNISVDVVAGQALVTFTNSGPSGANFSIYYDYADVQVNKICVTPNYQAISDIETTDVSLSVWGIKQEEAYVNSTGSKPGWVNHIDAYRSPAGAFMVAGLGGNLFREAQRTEAVNITNNYGNVFNIPLLYPDLRARIQNQLNVAPTFWQSTDSPNRTRGYMTADNLVGTNRAAVEAIEWQEPVLESDPKNKVRYILSMKNHTTFPGTGDVIETTDGFEDELIVESTNYSQFNGTFKIVAHGSAGTDLYYFDVINPAVTDGDFNVDADSAGSARIETDNMLLTQNGEFLVGDELQSDFFDGTQVLKVVGTDAAGTTIKVTGFTKGNNFPAGLRLTGLRTSNILPLRFAASLNNDDVGNFVRGDMVKYTDYERQFEVLHVNTLIDTEVDIAVSAGVATVTGASTTGLAVGQQVLLVRAGVHSGVQTITAITATDAFTFTTTETADGPDGSTLKGKTIQIDEAIQFQDAVENTKTVQVPRRWIPIELPVSSESGTLTPVRRTTYFDSNTYTSQAFIRSTMVSNNMYLTDGDGAVHKYDGGNIYRAGLFRWQPHLFVSTDTAPTDADNSGVIAFEGNDVLVDSFAGSVFTVDSGDETRFEVGNTVRHKINNTEYVVRATADTKITVNKAITADAVSTTVADGSGAANQINLTDATGFFIGADIVNNNDNEHYEITNIAAGAGTQALITLDRNFVGTKNGAPIALLIRLQKEQIYSYYFRLNAVDSNDNRIASAVTGAEDFKVPLYESSQIRMRLVGMPIWDIYDYDRLEVEIYRTEANGKVFYPIATIPMDFVDTYGYIDFIDTDSDEVLGGDDPIVSTLTPTGLGQQFSEPLRAKYITSSDNKLILANITDYPELSIQLFDNGPRIDIDVLTGNRWLFKRDSEGIATGTDIENSIELEFVKDEATTVDTVTSITIGSGQFTINGPTLVAGEWVYLYHADVLDQNDVSYSGWWKVGAGNVVTWPGASTALGTLPNRVARAPAANRGVTVPVFLGLDGNYAMANGNREDVGNVQLPYEYLAMRRLANGINVLMRYASDPWIIANAGAEYSIGQLVIRSPKVLSTTPEVVLPNYALYDPELKTGFNIFVNNIRRAPNADVSALVKTYPSRLIVSGTNYAEIFNNPKDSDENFSTAAVDVNSADGQEITGVIPFFGDSAFGSAQKGAVIVVFKENSIYLVDYGRGISKIESQGLGCTAPYSIASTRDGIMFANESGMFRLTRDMRIEYIGQKVERIWQDGEVNLDQLSIAQGTHYALGRQYKLSVPVSTDAVNSEVMVYNHTREYRGKGFGSWTRYDNHAATGWANLRTNAFFGAANGMVFRLRNEGSETDYRDRAGAYTMTATMRAMDFGDAGRRKAISKVIMQYRVADDQDSTIVSSAPDLGKDFTAMDAFEINKAPVSDSLSDEQGDKVKTISFSPSRRKLVFFQLKLENTAKDEIVELAGIDLRISGLTDEGITQAANTKDQS